MIRLRPHHLLCMLTFRGRGYTPQFVENFKDILERIKVGESIQIVEGADDVCASLLGTSEWHCDTQSVKLRDQLALEDVAKTIFPKAKIGAEIQLTPEAFDKAYEAFQEEGTQKACYGCQWNKFCNKILAEEIL